MARGYSKEDVVEAALVRFEGLGSERVEGLRKMFNEHYDKVGKDKFRDEACVTPEAMKIYLTRRGS